MFDETIREIVDAVQKHKMVVYELIEERNQLRGRVAVLEMELAKYRPSRPGQQES